MYTTYLKKIHDQPLFGGGGRATTSPKREARDKGTARPDLITTHYTLIIIYRMTDTGFHVTKRMWKLRK